MEIIPSLNKITDELLAPYEWTGKTKPLIRHYEALLDNLSVPVVMNELTQNVEVCGMPWDSLVTSALLSRIEPIGYDQRKRLESAIESLAFRNHFNPIESHLESCLQKYEGLSERRDFIGELADHFKTNCPNFRHVLEVFLVRACGKFFAKCQNYMLVLDGGQGLGKSFFCKWLSPRREWFSDTRPNFKKIEDYLYHMSINAFMEIPEWKLKGDDQDPLKAMLTYDVAQFRRPYDKSPKNYIVRASLIGTFNNYTGILVDETGNRRFVIVKVTDLDRSYTDIPIDLIWGQAYSIFKEHGEIDLTPEEKAWQEETNKSYMVTDDTDDLEDRITKHFCIDPARYDWFTSNTDIDDQLKAVNVPAKLNTRTNRRKVLTRLGCESATVRNGKEVSRGYRGIISKGIITKCNE